MTQKNFKLNYNANTAPKKDLKTTPLTEWATNELKRAVNKKNEANTKTSLTS